MKVEINDIAMSKNVKKLLVSLIKTANKFSKFEQKKFEVDISFVSPVEIQTLNKNNRNIDSPTDVLSFPTLNLKPLEKVNIKDFKQDINPQTRLLFLGDIVICNEVAQKNAKEYGHSYERELCYLVVHGFLHLLGYDHVDENDKKIMRALEEAVLKKHNIIR